MSKPVNNVYQQSVAVVMDGLVVTVRTSREPTSSVELLIDDAEVKYMGWRCAMIIGLALIEQAEELRDREAEDRAI